MSRNDWKLKHVGKPHREDAEYLGAQILQLPSLPVKRDSWWHQSFPKFILWAAVTAEVFRGSSVKADKLNQNQTALHGYEASFFSWGSASQWIKSKSRSCDWPRRIHLPEYTKPQEFVSSSLLGEGFSNGLAVKNPPAGDAGDVGLIPGGGRSPEGRNGNPLQYSCLENPVDRGS